MKQDYKKLTAYEVMGEQTLDDINSQGVLLRHRKTGARVALVANEDDNKVFYIGFRTTPRNSTGVMHILEHSVLCGSEKFPIKDPFIELAKGSLNTFLNAMTFPDKTVYPVASTNDKDFQNLCHVYLDAVFYPNILKSDMTFKQEGWHYDLQTQDGDLTINGVVYNEMKGAFSSPDDVLERNIFSSLFPDTTYGQESGGDPKFIPDLTYEEFIETYHKYYHPSNSYIYLYGDMDMIEKLEFIDREYLSAFDKLVVDSQVESQKPFDKPIEVKKSYSITESEPTVNNSYLSYNTVMADNLDPLEYIAMQVVDYALCSTPGAVLKQALLDRNIGKDVYGLLENGIKQPYFSIVAKNSDEEKKDEFVSVIEQVLKEVILNGFDKDTLKAALNGLEFRFREGDFGSYPPGLMYGIQALDSWLYDDEKPFLHVAAGEAFKTLRQKIDTDYFEQLVDKYIIKNTHKSIVIVVPQVGLVEEEEKKLSKKLSEYKASLTDEQISKIVLETAKLVEYQEAEESEEDLASIPVLELKDIKKECAPIRIQERQIGNRKSLYHNIDTRGIDYFRVLFDITDIPKELLGYVGILKHVLGLVDTKNLSYTELFNKIHINTGGIAAGVSAFTDAKNIDSHTVTFEWKGKVLRGGLGVAFEIIDEIIGTSVLDNSKRNYELIAELKSHISATMMAAGHQVAIGRIGSYYSKSSATMDYITGLTSFRLIEKLERDFDKEDANLANKLKELCCYVFTKDNIFFDFAGDETEYQEFERLATELMNKLGTKEENLQKAGICYNPSYERFIPNPMPKNEGIMSSSQVNYVCRAGNFIRKGLPYIGALRVLKVIMSYDYLWQNVRVKNGAYGCMNSFGKTGDAFFVSYRDPNLSKTIDVYEGITDYLESFDATKREMTQYIIGTISEMDTPLQPSARALRDYVIYVSNLTIEDCQRERDEVLATTVEDIASLKKYIEAIFEDGYICVVGNEEAIKSEEERFMNLINLLTS